MRRGKIGGIERFSFAEGEFARAVNCYWLPDIVVDMLRRLLEAPILRVRLRAVMLAAAKPQAEIETKCGTAL
jgi:hypothetical protein